MANAIQIDFCTKFSHIDAMQLCQCIRKKKKKKRNPKSGSWIVKIPFPKKKKKKKTPRGKPINKGNDIMPEALRCRKRQQNTLLSRVPPLSASQISLDQIGDILSVLTVSSHSFPHFHNWPSWVWRAY